MSRPRRTIRCEKSMCLCSNRESFIFTDAAWRVSLRGCAPLSSASGFPQESRRAYRQWADAHAARLPGGPGPSSDRGNRSPALTLKPVSDMLTPCWYVQQEAQQMPPADGMLGLPFLWLKWSLKVNTNENPAYRRKSLCMKLGLTRLFCKAK